MVDPGLYESYACTACGRPVLSTIAGLAGRLGYCPCSDADTATMKLRPVLPADQVAELRQRRADHNALRRARLKKLTDEGRKKLTPRELSALMDAGEAD